MAVVTAPRSGEDRVLLENISWSTYEALLEDLGPRRGVHVTYDRGLLEIMTLSPRHERIRALLARFIAILALELDLEVAAFGATTWKRRDLRRGFEGDECYYVASERLVREKEDIDLRRDPPPDLLVEVDITRSSLKREAIHAAFGIPEVWRYDDETQRVRFYVLEEGGEGAEDRPYREVERSVAFPRLDAADLNRFLAMHGSVGDTTLTRTFGDWVRQTLRQS